MRNIVVKALLLAVCGVAVAHSQTAVPMVPYVSMTTASTRAEFEHRWADHYHLNASRVHITSFEPIVGGPGARVTFVILGEGHKCDMPPTMEDSSMTPNHEPTGTHGNMPPHNLPSGSHGSMPPHHLPSGSHGSMPPHHLPSGSHGSMPPHNLPSGSQGSLPPHHEPTNMPPHRENNGTHGNMPPHRENNDTHGAMPGCAMMEPNDLSQKSAQEIDAVLMHSARNVFKQLGMFELTHGKAWTWRVEKNGTVVVKPKAHFEVAESMTEAALATEINRVAGSEVVASVVCHNATQEQMKGRVSCDVEFVSQQAALEASGNSSVMTSVFSSYMAADESVESGSATSEPSSGTTSGGTIAAVVASALVVVGVVAVVGVLRYRRTARTMTAADIDESLVSVNTQEEA